MAFVASSMARVPREGFNWYIFMVEDDFNDALRSQLRDNFESLGRAVGPDALVVRAFDPGQMKWGALYATPPALVVTDRVPIYGDPSSEGRMIEFELTNRFARDQFSIVPLLQKLVRALNDPEAMRVLERDTVEPGSLRRFWGWVAEYTELKPNFMGFGVNLNAIIKGWANSRP